MYILQTLVVTHLHAQLGNITGYLMISSASLTHHDLLHGDVWIFLFLHC